MIVRALGNFGDPALAVRSCDLLLDGTCTVEDLWRLAGSPVGLPEPEARAAARWEWITRRFGDLRRAFGEETAAELPGFVDQSPSPRLRAAVAGFFASLRPRPEGTDRNLALALGAMERNERRAGVLRQGFDGVLSRVR
jgi:hypothetical protein